MVGVIAGVSVLAFFVVYFSSNTPSGPAGLVGGSGGFAQLPTQPNHLLGPGFRPVSRGGKQAISYLTTLVYAAKKTKLLDLPIIKKSSGGLVAQSAISIIDSAYDEGKHYR